MQLKHLQGGFVKAYVPVLLVLLQAAALPARADFYQWTDAQGVIHLSNDRDNIPGKYRKRARRVQDAAPPAVSPKPAGGDPGAAPAEPAGQPILPGGHPESWWRERYFALRSDIAALEQGLPGKRVRLLEVQRERRIFMRARDREAANALESEIGRDETRIVELNKMLDALEAEAARAGVPLEWRR